MVSHQFNVRKEIDQYVLEIKNELENFNNPNYTKNQLFNISGRFSGIFNELRGLREVMVSISKEIDEKVSSIDNWPGICKTDHDVEQIKQNVLVKKKIIIELLDFLYEEAKKFTTVGKLAVVKAKERSLFCGALQSLLFHIKEISSGIKYA
uniref:Uncharacterized protein n=1 Tax=Meloidogyne enterolobii TaxID=390850 RepID=A0A6V7WKD9_MELEN|nr:unnamed protein product [Meloidogyne enterolobii]